MKLSKPQAVAIALVGPFSLAAFLVWAFGAFVCLDFWWVFNAPVGGRVFYIFGTIFLGVVFFGIIAETFDRFSSWVKFLMGEE